MSERKVLNQYIPVNFDPSIIPKSFYKRPHQYKTRIMLPFNVQCSACNHFMYRARKFNAKKETAEQRYLGLAIFRFYFRCENCANEITFLTDPEHFNYTLERGAQRMFDYAVERQQAMDAIRNSKAGDEGDVMKMLENRTQDSLRERLLLENIDDLEELRKQQESLDVFTAIEERKKQKEKELMEEQLQREQEDEEEVQKLFGKDSTKTRLAQLELLQKEFQTSPDLSTYETSHDVDEHDSHKNIEDGDIEEFDSEDEYAMMFGVGEKSTEALKTIKSLQKKLQIQDSTEETPDISGKQKRTHNMNTTETLEDLDTTKKQKLTPSQDTSNPFIFTSTTQSTDNITSKDLKSNIPNIQSITKPPVRVVAIKKNTQPNTPSQSLTNNHAVTNTPLFGDYSSDDEDNHS